MVVTGTMGVIPERKIHSTLEGKLRAFQRCFFEGSAEVEPIGGAVDLYFRVGEQGQVEWVYLRSSSVGHQATEACIVSEAARTRFPAPKGGPAAEFGWSFELDSVTGGRPPVAWDASDVASVLETERASLDVCGVGPFEITAYVAPGGQVLGAGAASRERDAQPALACVATAVRAWTMPDPGSHPAKVTFEAP
jgi:hypothetical protein